MKKILILLFLLFAQSLYFISQGENYVSVKAKSGDGISIILLRYGLEINQSNIDFIKGNNSAKIINSNELLAGSVYFLPIKIYKYNGINIRSSIGITDYNQAKKIQSYNLLMTKRKLKKGDYRKDKEIWVPLFLTSVPETVEQTASKPKSDLPKNIIEPLFGDKFKNVNIINHSLSGCVFYIVSGHGGIDPGAVGFKDGNELHEDEYAYDVSLRLARKLLEYGADVNIIVQDSADGIRDDKYLKNSFNEIHIGNQAIPYAQNERLLRRASIINEMYNQNLQKGKKQYCIETHVDSRYTGKKVDIFFYYRDGSSEGKKLARNLMKTVEQKYNKAQPGRGYKGSVSTRSLYMLRNVKPPFVFIEIGNIQNPRDQIRIIESNNRQAIANWFCEGILFSITGK
ncbi:MAG: N-acetylmuramoyl-L-alanine amidase [Candidatus Kapabacteria bacterium]|nr:N-acetylmuramoyl-L-alanine amidase [Candidatus Kapabacteria bacterium]